MNDKIYGWLQGWVCKAYREHKCGLGEQVWAQLSCVFTGLGHHSWNICFSHLQVFWDLIWIVVIQITDLIDIGLTGTIEMIDLKVILSCASWNDKWQLMVGGASKCGSVCSLDDITHVKLRGVCHTVPSVWFFVWLPYWCLCVCWRNFVYFIIIFCLDYLLVSCLFQARVLHAASVACTIFYNQICSYGIREESSNDLRCSENDWKYWNYM